MDGAGRTVLHDTELVWPNALTVDYHSQLLYWADASLDKIERSRVDGTNRRIITRRGVFHPFGITVFENTLYWTDWELDSVLSRGESTNTTILFSNLQTEPMGIQVVTINRQPRG